MFAIRPKLVMTVSEPRCQEIVEISGTPLRANVLRLYVKNEGVRQTEVWGFIEEIRKEGKIIESEKSLLNSWIDVSTDQTVLGHDDSSYVNLCQKIENDASSLFVCSVKGDRGYNITTPGLYLFVVSVVGKGLHSGFRMSVEVYYDNEFQSLRFGSSNNRMRELRLGKFIVNAQNIKRLIGFGSSRPC